MILLTPDLRLALRANANARRAAVRLRQPEPDPVPVLKLFNPLGAGTWLATELGEDGDALFGLANLGFGCPELGYFSLSEIASLRLPYGLGIDRDLLFRTRRPLSQWAEAARAAGSIPAAELMFRHAARHGRAASDLPPASHDDGGG
ncbi:MULTISPECIES: DUF2958 domain-containing protein [unclassified Sphingomonas]|jgi:hypothetical protein|uniref:DUF2958 domain-containing protein n=1 Tax=unclassified Sphingomonas TaxID=196159 RepID=UPI000829D7B7|nr:MULTISPECIES: DUF2958 domain-containing protein [unclassified Sphingomonas]